MSEILPLHLGSRVVFKIEDGKVVLENSLFDAADALEKIARKVSSMSEMSSHVYEEELRAGNL